MIELISEYEEMKKVAAAISAIWLLFYFFVHQFMSKSFKLMIHLQFFSFIVNWSITYPKPIKNFLLEVRRVVLAEYFDDIEFS